jgi:DNA (cytosine-5)-methyltransferase 1
MRYLSVCSGIEAATAAWHPLGWTPVAFSEIEPFPCAVLAHHYPTVPNWGDLTRFHEWPAPCACDVAVVPSRPRLVDDTVRNIVAGDGQHAGAGSSRDVDGATRDARCARCGGAAIDVLVGGTPCQSFSVAGLRQGLRDPRGNLALTYLAVADRYRPRWLVWENVPGVLSSGGGRDFGAFLGGLAELGYGFAYRVLDAQYFGLAQRRKRVFVVASARDWRRAAAVLFERESLSGHPAPRREAGQDVAGCLVPGTHPGGFNGQDAYSGQLVAHALRADGFDAGEDGTGRGTPLVPMVFDLAQITSAANRTRVEPGRPSSTLAKQSRMHVATQMSVRRLTPRECERLQGFPDDYTMIPYRGKPAADGPRYKALGNSMAVPVVAWIGRRIAMVDALNVASEEVA